MEAVGARLRQAGVVAIYLVHGTFIGPDGLGLLTSLSNLSPGLADVFRGWHKQLVDSVAGDLGNFTRDYAETWQTAINPPGTSPIPVRLFHWSSENHHLGRADGAVRLLDEFIARGFTPDDRILVVSHSHGGNVLALVTNLLGGNRETRNEFFQAARNFYRGPILRRVDIPVWEALRERACSAAGSWPQFCIDVATLGTPVRYGWDTAGCDHLLHFINHRPTAGVARYQAFFPPTSNDLWCAAPGDFVQQIGIAGTNFLPPIWAYRACDAELRLGRLLQADESTAGLLARLRLGVRTHEDGENLLIDYGPAAGTPAQHLFGHALYTRKDWLLFHAEQIAHRMYGLPIEAISLHPH